MNEQWLAEAVKIFKVLSNESRVRILYFLENNEADVTTIVDGLGIDQPQVSHQLAMLYRYQLVSKRRAGRHMFYVLDDPHILAVVDAMLAHVSHEITGQPHPRQADITSR